MYVNWKALFSLGLAFWCLLCCTDLLGDSTWKKCSGTLDDILKGQYNEFVRMQQEREASESANSHKQKMNWSLLLWNICAFLCSLVFCSVIRSMSWMVWKIITIYNVFRNRKTLTNKITNNKSTEEDISSVIKENKENCKVIFKNQLFSPVRTDSVKDQLSLSKELENVKKEKSELCQQLLMAQKENISARQQIEEYKLENFMMKERLAKASNSLKENLKSKDASQEVIVRKTFSLEQHLKEVCRDRDILRSKLSALEKNYNIINEKLKLYEKQDSETNLEQLPEKDTSPENEVTESEKNECPADVDMYKFQKKILALQRNINNFEAKKATFEANSKISMDLDESSIDTSKENDSEQLSGVKKQSKKVDVEGLKQNILNYNAYKAQMLRPKMRLTDIKEQFFSSDTTGSSSDENSGPHRIISSTAEFQNFLKTLTTNSGSNINFGRSFF